MKRSNRQTPLEPRPDDPAAPDPALEEPVFRAILWVMVFSVIAGVGLALSGELIFESVSIRNAGTGIGLLSGLIYFAFRRLGKREAERRRRGQRNNDKDLRDPDR